MSIFVAIASFCDPVLDFTISQALKMAKHPEEVFFGVVEQNYPDDALKNIPKNVRYMLVDPAHSKGACWARSVTMSLYNDEDWFFQIDSHSDFDQDWDEIFINHAKNLTSKNNSNFVISSYPNGFIIENGVSVKNPVTNGILTHVVKPNELFRDNTYAIPFEAHPFECPVAVSGFHVGAGCIFTKGSFVQKFPYDPYMYFMGEEQSMAIRLFTNGWNIYHIPAMPIYHLYNYKENKQPERKLHWDSQIETKRTTPWYELERRSVKRLSSLLNYDPDMGVYGLGYLRTLHEYADFSGIDYTNKTVHELAYKGHWKY